MSIVTIFLILLVVFLLFVSIGIFVWINSNHREVAPYDPKKEKDDNREEIKEIDKKIEEKKEEVYDATKTTNSDIINRFNAIKRN